MQFIGHCSNLHAWAENNYDTRLLHSNLAFPLLKRLTEVEDPFAKRVFKEEIIDRFLTGITKVQEFLIEDKYFNDFTTDELNCIIDDFHENLKRRYPNIFSQDYVCAWFKLAKILFTNGDINRSLRICSNALEVESAFRDLENIIKEIK